MADSSAKSQQDHAMVIRREFGEHVVLLNACGAPYEGQRLLDPNLWEQAKPVGTGRGANWYVDDGQHQFVLRHFRRGGAVARVLGDKYWFRSEGATRSFAEFNLLLELHNQNLPVPEPVAAGYIKSGPWYKAQLLTRRIPGAISWSSHLLNGSLIESQWQSIGCAIAAIHKAYVDHADLNAHNLLVDSSQSVFVIDFDKSSKRPSFEGHWRHANLERLRRSLNKIMPGDQVLIKNGWHKLMAAYMQEFDRNSGIDSD